MAASAAVVHWRIKVSADCSVFFSALPPSFFQEEEGKCQFYTKQQLILEVLVLVLGIQLSVQKRRKGKERKGKEEKSAHKGYRTKVSLRVKSGGNCCWGGQLVLGGGGVSGSSSSWQPAIDS